MERPNQITDFIKSRGMKHNRVQNLHNSTKYKVLFVKYLKLTAALSEPEYIYV